MAARDDREIRDPYASRPAAPPPRSLFESAIVMLAAIAVFALGLWLSGMLLIAAGLSATGVGAGGGILLLIACVPAPAGLALAIYLWRKA
jgi:hypothetical protein